MSGSEPWGPPSQPRPGGSVKSVGASSIAGRAYASAGFHEGIAALVLDAVGALVQPSPRHLPHGLFLTPGRGEPLRQLVALGEPLANDALVARAPRRQKHEANKGESRHGNSVGPGPQRRRG